jgi:8-oxo-dGTP pyrophosphatase MutT (NUDIX family)
VGASPYIRRIRERIGQDLLLLPAVSVLIWDDDGRLLLVRGADTGTWQMIGGAVEPGESPWDAARRETAEETGLEVSLTQIRGVIGGPPFQHTYPNGDQVAFVSTVFDARIVSGTPVPDDDEVIEIAWFDPAELAAGARDAPGSARDETLPELALAILDAVGISAAASAR